MKCDCGGEAPMVWTAPGVGTAHCEKCGHLAAAICCPYIPVDLIIKEKNDE